MSDLTNQNDNFVGTIWPDVIHPGAGNDTVWAGNGNDVVDDSVSHAFWSIVNGILVFNPGIGQVATTPSTAATAMTRCEAIPAPTGSTATAATTR